MHDTARARSRAIVISLGALLAFSTSVMARAADLQTHHEFKIPAQALDTALLAFADQAKVQVLMWAGAKSDAQSPGATGELSAATALKTILDSTGFYFQQIDGETVAIVKAGTSAKAVSDRRNSGTGSSNLRLAQAGEPQNAPEEQTTPDSSDSQSNGELTSLKKSAQNVEEVVVTGTNIRGVTSSASPIQTFTREDIDRTGLGTLQSFFEKLPQNFSSISANTVSTVAGSTTSGNVAGASAINLRGLGSDSTLLLIDGHRVATGGLNGDIADISLIPLSVVDRIEIVTDGASAIYGSDAVGGVVNVILRKDFDGAETRARYGSVSVGASHESQIGQTFGKTWSSGSAVLSYEYLDSTPLSAADREFSRTAIERTDLLPEQVRHAVFATLQQDLANGFSLFADGTFSHRATNEFFSSLGFTQQNPADIEAFSGVVGTRARLSDRAGVEFSTSYSSSKQHIDAFESSFANGTSPQNSNDVNTSVLSFDAKVDGSLGFLQAGYLSYAVGVQWRQETLESGQYDFPSASSSASGTSFDRSRSIGAAFAELRIPLVAGSTRANPTLELNLADRYEHYGDFGDTNNPQLGLIWKPLADVKFRGTIGTSFKAPLLNDLNPNPSQIAVLPEFDPQGGQRSCLPFNTSNTCSDVIILLGGNPGLTSEKARTWTTGLDVKPSAIPGLSVSATYYDIYFKDQITDPGSLVPLTVALQNAPTLGPSIVQRNPSAVLVSQLATSPAFINPFNVDLGSVGAFVDYSFHNLSSVRTSGVDLNTSYKTALFAGEFETGIDGTYILKFHNKVIATTPETELLNTPFNPVNLRLRPRAEFRWGPFNAAAFLSYTNSYEDNRGPTPVPVASWTTVDMNFGYTCGNDCWFMQHATVLAGVTNLANRAPPYLANALGVGVNFDGTNANALGRFFFLQVSTKW